MTILKAGKASGYADYEELWVGHDISGEPLIDSCRLDRDNVLSLLVRHNVEESVSQRMVAVLDFEV